MSTPYVTLADVLCVIPMRKLAQITNDDPALAAAGNPDAAVVDRAIEAASHMVDGYLRARHALPLDPVPTIVRELTLNLVCYRLYARRMESEVSDTIKDQRDYAIRALEHIQSGRITIGDAATQKAAPEAGAIRIKAPPSQFGELTLSHWRL